MGFNLAFKGLITHAYIYTFIFIYIYMHLHIFTYTCVHIYIYTLVLNTLKIAQYKPKYAGGMVKVNNNA